MADHHHHQHRPHRISVPPRAASHTTTRTATPYPLHPYQSSTPTPTPSKTRTFSSSISRHCNNNKTSISFLLLLLLSLRSFYSILPFLRSSPSFSLFPFSFLVSLLSFLLTLSFSLFTSSSSSKRPFSFIPSNKQTNLVSSLASITQSQFKTLFTKSILLGIVFLLRFQGLRYCGTAAMILAELSGNVAARFLVEGRIQNPGLLNSNPYSKFRGFFALFSGLFLFSVSWDRIECFPFATSFIEKWGFSVFPRENCLRIWPMLLPFLSGFICCYERVSINWGTIKQLGRKQVRLFTLFFTTLLLFIPALVSILMFEFEVGSFSIGNFVWPLANTIIFGVLLSENFSNDNSINSKNFQNEFFLTFVCTLVLELLYFPELSLWGLLLCGLLLYIAVRELDPVYASNLKLGMDPHSDSFTTLIMKPLLHILSERKSRKIALFLLINTGYMVVEFVAGFMSNSLGLISDACHMLFDCAALAIGLYASYISRFPANSEFNYGRGRFEVLSGYTNAVFLVLVGALIVLESLERILDPQEISTNSLLTVSVGGLAVNVVGLVFFHEEHHHAHGGSGSSCSHSLSPKKHLDHHHTHVNHHDQAHEHDSHDHHNQVYHPDHSHKHESHDHHEHESHDHHNHNSHKHESHDHTHSCAQHDHHDHDHVHQNLHHQHHKHGSHDHSYKHESHDHHGHDHTHSCAQHDHHYDHDDHDHAHQNHHHHHHIDHNMEGIFLHVLADTLGSVGVVISTLLIKHKGWLAADPACSIFISVLIVSSVIPLLRNTSEILLQRVPRAHEGEVRKAVNDIMKIRGIRGIQNLHFWSFTNTDVVGTLQLHVSTEIDKPSVKAEIGRLLQDVGVKDLTLQVESVG